MKQKATTSNGRVRLSSTATPRAAACANSAAASPTPQAANRQLHTAAAASLASAATASLAASALLPEPSQPQQHAVVAVVSSQLRAAGHHRCAVPLKLPPPSTRASCRPLACYSAMRKQESTRERGKDRQRDEKRSSEEKLALATHHYGPSQPGCRLTPLEPDNLQLMPSKEGTQSARKTAQ